MSARKRGAPKQKSNSGIVAFALVVSAAFFSIPFVMHFGKVRTLSSALHSCTKEGAGSLHDDDWRWRTLWLMVLITVCVY